VCIFHHHQNRCRLNIYFLLSLIYIYPLYFFYCFEKISDSLSIYQVN
jgi:hypothetical protein